MTFAYDVYLGIIFFVVMGTILCICGQIVQAAEEYEGVICFIISIIAVILGGHLWNKKQKEDKKCEERDRAHDRTYYKDPRYVEY